MTLDEIRALTPAQLAGHLGLDTSNLDTDPAAVYMADVRDWYVEHRDEFITDPGILGRAGKDATEGGALPVSQHNQWSIFTLLAVWAWRGMDTDTMETALKGPIQWDYLTSAIREGLSAVTVALVARLWEDDSANTEHDPYAAATPERIDYDRIADAGDPVMYRRAWDENPGERDTLEDLFPDLHTEAFES